MINGRSTDLEVSSGFEELGKAERLRDRIATILVDAFNDPCHLPCIQESPALLGVVVREGHEEDVASKSNQYG